MQIIKVSPKGQITIPKKAREACDSGQYLFEMNGRTIILRPVQIVIAKDELNDFGFLSEKAFSFWDNKDDDIYQEFYNQK